MAGARRIRNRIIADYQEIAESAMACLDEGFESAISVMLLPVRMCRYYHTSNHVELLNKVLKRRSRVIGVFPNKASLLWLMGSVLIERHKTLSIGRAILSQGTLATLLPSVFPAKLVIIAVKQQKLLAA